MQELGKYIKAGVIVAAGFISSVNLPAYADTKKDIGTLAKAIGFVNGGPKGTVDMDVLCDPSNVDSVSHADEIVGLTSKPRGSKVKLKGKKVTSAGDLSSRVIFITRGAGAMYDAALDKAAANKGITVSTDMACLGSGCVLVVKTKPSVDILVSTAASSKVGIEFASAFSMMINKK